MTASHTYFSFQVYWNRFAVQQSRCCKLVRSNPRTARHLEYINLDPLCIWNFIHQNATLWSSPLAQLCSQTGFSPVNHLSICQMNKCKCYLETSCPEMKTDGECGVGGAEVGLSRSLQVPLIRTYVLIYVCMHYFFFKAILFKKAKNTACLTSG